MLEHVEKIRRNILFICMLCYLIIWSSLRTTAWLCFSDIASQNAVANKNGYFPLQTPLTTKQLKRRLFESEYQCESDSTFVFSRSLVSSLRALMAVILVPLFPTINRLTGPGWGPERSQQGPVVREPAVDMRGNGVSAHKLTGSL